MQRALPRQGRSSIPASCGCRRAGSAALAAPDRTERQLTGDNHPCPEHNELLGEDQQHRGRAAQSPGGFEYHRGVTIIGRRRAKALAQRRLHHEALHHRHMADRLGPRQSGPRATLLTPTRGRHLRIEPRGRARLRTRTASAPIRGSRSPAPPRAGAPRAPSAPAVPGAHGAVEVVDVTRYWLLASADAGAQEMTVGRNSTWAKKRSRRRPAAESANRRFKRTGNTPSRIASNCSDSTTTTTRCR